MVNFHIISDSNFCKARAGIFKTDHSIISTPVFMPVGTIGAVKCISQRDLINDIGSNIILGNTYHLYLRPGLKVLYKSGGIHKFINWNRSILTDSGGFQVYSLSNNIKKSDEGVTFKSHIDGSYHFFSPERCMEIQRTIGADIIMAFDDLIGVTADYNNTLLAMNNTHKWLKRCYRWLVNNNYIYNYKQFFFGIVQGGIFPKLRKYSAEFIRDMDLDGNAIGGLSVGEPEDIMYSITDSVTNILPKNKIRYLMGVGTPWNILNCIELGVDMFDCVMPTRNARNGMLFTWNGVINIKNKKWKYCYDPIDNISSISSTYTKAYLRHLFKCQEYLGKYIATIHNLAFYMDLLKQSREHIIKGDFISWKNSVINDLKKKL